MQEMYTEAEYRADRTEIARAMNDILRDVLKTMKSIDRAIDDVSGAIGELIK